MQQQGNAPSCPLSQSDLLTRLQNTLPLDPYITSIANSHPTTTQLLSTTLLRIFLFHTQTLPKINALNLLEQLFLNGQLESLREIVSGELLEHFEKVIGSEEEDFGEEGNGRVLRRVYRRLVGEFVGEVVGWGEGAGRKWGEMGEVYERLMKKAAPLREINRRRFLENIEKKKQGKKKQGLSQDDINLELPDIPLNGSVIRNHTIKQQDEMGLPDLDLPQKSMIKRQLPSHLQLTSTIKQKQENITSPKTIPLKHRTESFESFIKNAASDAQALAYLQSQLSNPESKNEKIESVYTFKMEASILPQRSLFPQSKIQKNEKSEMSEKYQKNEQNEKNEDLEHKIDSLTQRITTLESEFRTETNELKTTQKKLQSEVQQLRAELTKMKENAVNDHSHGLSMQESKRVSQISYQVSNLKDQLQKLKTTNTSHIKPIRVHTQPFSPSDDQPEKRLISQTSALSRLLNPQNRLKSNRTQSSPFARHLRMTTQASLNYQKDSYNQEYSTNWKQKSIHKQNKTVIIQPDSKDYDINDWASPTATKMKKHQSSFDSQINPPSLLFKKACFGLVDTFYQTDSLALSLNSESTDIGAKKFYLNIANTSETKTLNIHICLKSPGIFQIQPNFSEKIILNQSDLNTFTFMIKGFDLERFSIPEVPQISFSLNGNYLKSQLPISIFNFCSFRPLDHTLSESFTRKSQVKINFIRTTDQSQSLWRSFLLSKNIRHPEPTTHYRCLIFLTQTPSTKCCLQLQFDSESRQCKFSYTTPNLSETHSSLQLSRVVFRTLRLVLSGSEHSFE